MSLEYNKNNIMLAKDLRKKATPQEKHLWYDFLSKYEIRFQRQKAIGNFIADFYCHQARLIIEIDGSQHFIDENRLNDEKRDIALNKWGITVLRYTNDDINRSFDTVCNDILEKLGISVEDLH